MHTRTPVLGLCIDVAKVFDDSDYEFLLDNLYSIGFRGKMHCWLAGYLALQFQHVEVHNTKLSLLK